MSLHDHGDILTHNNLVNFIAYIDPFELLKWVDIDECPLLRTIGLRSPVALASADWQAEAPWPMHEQSVATIRLHQGAPVPSSTATYLTNL